MTGSRKRTFPHIIKKQIEEKLRQQSAKTVIPSKKATTYSQDTVQSGATDTSIGMIIPYLMAVLGNRVIDGFRVIRPPSYTGMTVQILRGEAIFDIVKRIEKRGSSDIDIPVYSDDQWVYIYLAKDGEFLTNKYSPIIGDNINYIPLATIWVEAGSTEIDSHFIVDIRPSRIATLSEIYGIRSQQAELYNVFPNSFIGTDKVQLNSVVGQMKIQIQPNSSKLIYGQGHAIVLPETTIDLEKPGSGLSKDYYIVAHGYIDYIELIYKIAYYQIEVGSIIPRYQCVIGRIKGLTNGHTEITSDMIDISMQRNTKYLLEVPYNFNFIHKGNLYAYPLNVGVIRISPSRMKIIKVKAYLRISYAGSGLIDKILIDIKINGTTIFKIESGVEHRLSIPISTPNESIIVGTGTIETQYIEEGDIVLAEISEVPLISGYCPKDLKVELECKATTERPDI